MSNPGKINEITVTVHLTNQQYTDVQIERIEIAAPQSIKCTVTVIRPPHHRNGPALTTGTSSLVPPREIFNIFGIISQ
jgi:hypothetical protein